MANSVSLDRCASSTSGSRVLLASPAAPLPPCHILDEHAQDIGSLTEREQEQRLACFLHAHCITSLGAFPSPPCPGLIAMTKTVAREYAARGITANCVAPGFIATGGWLARLVAGLVAGLAGWLVGGRVGGLVGVCGWGGRMCTFYVCVWRVCGVWGGCLLASPPLGTLPLLPGALRSFCCWGPCCHSGSKQPGQFVV